MILLKENNDVIVIYACIFSVLIGRVSEHVYELVSMSVSLSQCAMRECYKTNY